MTSPAQIRCGVQAQAEKLSFTFDGGTGAMRVTTNPECTWSAQSEAPWVTLTPPMNGQGEGTVQFTVAANGLPSSRSTAIKVEDQRLQISQDARPCEFRLSSTLETVEAAGGEHTVQVTTTSAQCRWTAISDVPWITIVSGREGDNSGVVTFRVEPLSGPQRAGTLTIGGQTVQVQQGAGCSYSVGTEALNVGAAGGTTEVAVSAPVGCTWTAQSGVPWITLTRGATGSGPGVVTLQVASTDGPTRSGTVTIAGQTVQVQQGAGCSYSVGTEAINVGAAGGATEVAVSAPAGCTWTAQSGVPWITLPRGAAGSGPGVLALQVASTDGPTRTGTVTIAGRVVTVTQSPGCSFTIDPLTYAAPAAASTSATTVRAGPGCAWTAASSSDWIVITAGQSGSGAGDVRFSIAGNSGPSRAGSIGIAGQTVTVNQASGCAITVTPTNLSVAAAASANTIQVTTAQGCTWSAASGASWITIGGVASGSGSGQVSLSIAANSSPARQGTLTVGGHTVTVSQASGCTYTVTPPSQDVAPAGGTATASIATGSGCPWSASSSATWITPGATSGSGPAQVALTVAPNNGPDRTGTVTVASTVLTVNQGSPCGWVLAPPFHTYGPEGGNGNVLVIVTGACTWTAASNDAWITLTAGASGTGNGLVQFVAAPNNGPARTGSLTIAGRRYDVIQAAR